MTQKAESKEEVLECEGKKKDGRTGGKKNDNIIIIEERKKTQEIERELECNTSTIEEDSNDGIIGTDGDNGEGDGRSTASSKISVREAERKNICKRNLAKYKMVRTNRGLVCEVDRSEEEKAQRGRSEDKYKHTHVGQKIVEASLIPSHKVSNNEANKARILRYIHGQGHKVASVKNSGYGRLDLFFNGFSTKRQISVSRIKVWREVRYL